MIVITQSSPALAAPLPGLVSPWSFWCSCRGGTGDSWGSAESFCDFCFDASQRCVKCAVNIHPGHSFLSVVPRKCL